MTKAPRSKATLLLWPLAGILLIIVGFFAAQLIKPVQNPVPGNIASELHFTPLVVPGDANGITTKNYELGPEDSAGKPLSFVIIINDKEVFVSQAMLPPQFSEVPEYKDRFIDSFILNRKTTSSGIGTIYYGLPANNKAYRQVALLLDRGLLTIMSTKSDTLSETEFRKIGDTLVPAK